MKSWFRNKWTTNKCAADLVFIPKNRPRAEKKKGPGRKKSGTKAAKVARRKGIAVSLHGRKTKRMSTVQETYAKGDATFKKRVLDAWTAQRKEEIAKDKVLQAMTEQELNTYFHGEHMLNHEDRVNLPVF